MLGFAAVLALNLLTKGLIGIVFPLAFAILYLAFTRELPLLRKLSIFPATIFFLAIALPWHILAALRNPAIAMPAGLGLPQKREAETDRCPNERRRFDGRSRTDANRIVQARARRTRPR